MSIVAKLRSFWFGPSDSYDAEDFEDLFDSGDDVYATSGQLALSKAPIEPARTTRQSAKVLEHPNSQPSSEVLVIEPRSFDEALDIVGNLRQRKSVLLNLHMIDKEQSQRVVDFLAGATHAIDGHQQRIGEGVFLFAPANVQINAESNSSKAIKDVFWNKTQTGV